MFWDNVAWAYDLFADGINRKANKALCAAVEKLIFRSDEVLECACGTGLLPAAMAPKCKNLIATDFSEKMLKRAGKKLKGRRNVRFERSNILNLPYPDERFDAVVAANVIHLLENPAAALNELDRVCKSGGRLIIPTYMNKTDKGKRNGLSGAVKKVGTDFKNEFTFKTYRQFFADAGYENTRFILCDGRIPCAVAVIEKT